MTEMLLKKVETLNHEQAAAIYNFIMVMSNKEGSTPKPKPPAEPINVYQANDTMRMLGYQYRSEAAAEPIEDIVKAYGLQDSFYNNDLQLFSLINDVFNYGMIEGKRELRQRKKARSGNKTKEACTSNTREATKCP